MEPDAAVSLLPGNLLSASLDGPGVLRGRKNRQHLPVARSSHRHCRRALRRLPPLAALNFVGVVAFGYFVFKAGYTQSELLFYTLHLLTFIASWQMFVERERPAGSGMRGPLACWPRSRSSRRRRTCHSRRSWWRSATGHALIVLARRRQAGAALRAAAPAIVFGVVFLLILSPYLRTSKQIHGQYFYNLNTAALMLVRRLSGGGGRASCLTDRTAGRPAPDRCARARAGTGAAIRWRRSPPVSAMASATWRPSRSAATCSLARRAVSAGSRRVVTTRRRVVVGLVRRHMPSLLFWSPMRVSTFQPSPSTSRPPARARRDFSSRISRRCCSPSRCC